MNEMVYPLSAQSVLICHFPERRPQSYFYADRYTHVVCNSRYTAEWIEKKWKFTPHRHIYPPVDMDAGDGDVPRKNIILSVARFEPQGYKRQREMIAAFLKLHREWPEIVQGWRFILAGGSAPGNPYLSGLEKMIAGHQGCPVEMRTNCSADELKSLYRESAIFWHLCGWKQEDPGETEHFGMTTVEAMQNGMVPLVYDGGGLREIVDHDVNGFRVRSSAELLDYSMTLFGDQALVERLGRAAREKSQMFARKKFEATVRGFFGEIHADLTSSAPGRGPAA